MISSSPGEPSSIANEGGMALLMACLDDNFAATDVSELVQAFGNLLFHTRRKTSPEPESMGNHIARFRIATRKCGSLNSQVPDGLAAFLMLS